MKLNQFRDVVAIAERGSLRAAARHLGLAQPALTRSVHELERELGAPLFERGARGMTLTVIGQAFLRRARFMMNEVRHAKEEAEQFGGATSGTVIVGLSIAPHIGILPKVLTPFRTRFPEVQLHIIEGQYPPLEAGLKEGRVDIYVGPLPERALPADLVRETLFDNTRIVLGRAGHPLAKATSLRDLKDAEWATTSITDAAEEEMGDIFARHRVSPPRLALRSQSALTLLVSLAYSDLLAMVPVQWADFPVTAHMLAPIAVKEPLPAPPIAIVRRGGLPLTPAAEFFVDLVRRAAPAAL
jgi:LysR family transcriptional regulator, regulator of abg operon